MGDESTISCHQHALCQQVASIFGYADLWRLELSALQECVTGQKKEISR